MSMHACGGVYATASHTSEVRTVGEKVVAPDHPA